jgi:nitrite reductase/ring-hydroxylating ferredoxin subunit
VERPVDVGSADALVENQVKMVRVNGRDLGLVRRGDAVYAFRNVCPHMSTSFERGVVGLEAGGAVGAPEFLAGRPIVTCPWHRYEFSLVSGQCRTHKALRVRTYPARIEGGRVVVDLAGRVREPAGAIAQG